MKKSSMLKLLVSVLIIIFAMCIVTGCGDNAEEETSSPTNLNENDLQNYPLYGELQYIYEFAKLNNIEIPPYKDRNKVAKLLSREKLDEYKNSLISVSEESAGLFKGKKFKKTLEQSEYAYCGELNGDNCPDGVGVLFKAFNYYGDEAQPLIAYMGEFKDGKYHGYGVAFNIFEDGDDFLNNFSNLAQIDYDNYTVLRTFNYPIYEGYFEDGKYSGEGVEYLCNLGAVDLDTGETLLNPSEASYTYYIGEYRKGELNGDVKIYDKGVLQYEGEYKNENYNGKGILYFLEKPGQVQYEGEFSEGYFHGEGTLYDENGSIIHKGQFNTGDIA